MLANQRFFSFRDFERVLRAFGYELDITSGSHHIYVHRGIGRALSIQPQGAEAKVYQVRQFIQCSLTPDQLRSEDWMPA